MQKRIVLYFILFITNACAQKDQPIDSPITVYYTNDTFSELADSLIDPLMKKIDPKAKLINLTNHNVKISSTDRLIIFRLVTSPRFEVMVNDYDGLETALKLNERVIFVPIISGNPQWESKLNAQFFRDKYAANPILIKAHIEDNKFKDNDMLINNIKTAIYSKNS